MEKQETNFITFAEILKKVRRGKWTLIGCVVLSLLLVFLYNHQATLIYRASAIISFERFSRDSMLEVDFASARYETNFIANRIKELGTGTFAQKVFHALPDSFRQLFPVPDPRPTDFDANGHIIQMVKDGISVVQTEATPNVLTISFDSENAVLASKVTNTAVDVLKKNNLNYRRQEFASLKEFIDKQIKVVEQKLNDAEEALSNFKSSDNITSLEDESREILRRITQAENLYNQIQTDKQAKERKLFAIQRKIDEYKAEVDSTFPESSSPTIVKLKDKLVDLEVESASLQVQGYSEDHPRRQELSNEIKLIKQNLLELTMNVIEDQNLSGLLDPISVLRNYLEESIAMEIEIQALTAQQNHLQKTLASYNKRLNNLSAMDAALFDLVRDREVNNKLYVQLLEEREQARLREASEIGTIHVIEPAQTPLIPYKPRKKLNIIIAVFAGCFIGILLVFAKYALNDVPRHQEEVETILSLPVLTSIPKINSKKVVALNGDSTKANGRLTPLYRHAYTYLWHYIETLDRKKVKSILVTSATPGEGKSTVAANLAITAAKLGKKTLLIDGDLRKPTLARLLKASNSHGLCNFISIETELQELPISGLKFLSGGTLPNEVLSVPVEPEFVWTLPKLKKGLNRLMKDFDFVVIDSPPVLGIPDALNIAAYVDGIILCVEAEEAEKSLLLRAQKILTQTKGNLVGVVWNKVNPTDIYGKNKYKKYYQSAG